MKLPLNYVLWYFLLLLLVGKVSNPTEPPPGACHPVCVCRVLQRQNADSLLLSRGNPYLLERNLPPGSAVSASLPHPLSPEAEVKLLLRTGSSWRQKGV